MGRTPCRPLFQFVPRRSWRDGFSRSEDGLPEKAGYAGLVLVFFGAVAGPSGDHYCLAAPPVFAGLSGLGVPRGAVREADVGALRAWVRPEALPRTKQPDHSGRWRSDAADGLAAGGKSVAGPGLSRSWSGLCSPAACAWRRKPGSAAGVCVFGARRDRLLERQCQLPGEPGLDAAPARPLVAATEEAMGHRLAAVAVFLHAHASLRCRFTGVAGPGGAGARLAAAVARDTNRAAGRLLFPDERQGRKPAITAAPGTPRRWPQDWCSGGRPVRRSAIGRQLAGQP